MSTGNANGGSSSGSSGSDSGSSDGWGGGTSTDGYGGWGGDDRSGTGSMGSSEGWGGSSDSGGSDRGSNTGSMSTSEGWSGGNDTSSSDKGGRDLSGSTFGNTYGSESDYGYNAGNIGDADYGGELGKEQAESIAKRDFLSMAAEEVASTVTAIGGFKLGLSEIMTGAISKTVGAIAGVAVQDMVSEEEQVKQAAYTTGISDMTVESLMSTPDLSNIGNVEKLKTEATQSTQELMSLETARLKEATTEEERKAIKDEINALGEDLSYSDLYSYNVGVYTESIPSTIEIATSILGFPASSAAKMAAALDAMFGKVAGTDVSAGYTPGNMVGNVGPGAVAPISRGGDKLADTSTQLQKTTTNTATTTKASKIKSSSSSDVYSVEHYYDAILGQRHNGVTWEDFQSGDMSEPEVFTPVMF